MYSSQEIEPGIRRVKVDAASILRGDVLTIGERPCIVLDFTSSGDGSMGIRFVSGEFLSVDPATALTALRADAPGLATRSFWAARRPADHQRRLPSAAEIVAHVVVGCGLVIAVALAVVLR